MMQCRLINFVVKDILICLVVLETRVWKQSPVSITVASVVGEMALASVVV
jgi:hypothetical protein